MADEGGGKEDLSADDCLSQIEGLIRKYDRMVTRLRKAGHLPRNPIEKREVRACVLAVFVFLFASSAASLRVRGPSLCRRCN